MSDFWSDPLSISILQLPSLVAYVLSTIISWAGSTVYEGKSNVKKVWSSEFTFEQPTVEKKCKLSSLVSLCAMMIATVKGTKSEMSVTWTSSSEFGTYRLCEQRRFRRACASAQFRQNLRCSLIQAVSQEEPSDRKPDPWPLWMAGHAQLKFVMTECSKTQIRLTGPKWQLDIMAVIKVYLQ